MPEFEVVERDGLARLGRLTTPHGTIETPALLPVLHPDPARQPVPPAELAPKFGLRAAITSAYITWRTPALKEVALRDGLHRLVGFDGPLMTDSGAFQQHAYGHVEVGADEIVRFQESIGSDIATVLDDFVEPEADRATAARGVELTRERSTAARAARAGLLAVPVQGGLFPDLRFESAAAASETGDVLAVGGVVPLMEGYRFSDLAKVLLAARPGLAPERVVHLFGSGHPMTFAFAALFGVDLLDSSAYLKFARRGRLLFPYGTVDLEALREPTCRCVLCAEHPLPEVARWEPAPRERWVASHNLLISAQEISLVRQAIRDGTLWELAERRAAAHPALQSGMRRAVRSPRVFFPTEPASRRSFRVIGSTSMLRPSVIRFLSRLVPWREAAGAPRSHPWVPLLPRYLGGTPTETRDGAPIPWESMTPIGPVPLELTDLYPIGCYLSVEEFEDGSTACRQHGSPPKVDLDGLEVETRDDWSASWTRRHARAILSWEFGASALERLDGGRLAGDRSRRTGRLRHLLVDGRPAFFVGDDGLPRPTWWGAGELHRALPFPEKRVVVEPDAVDFVAEGRTLFAGFAERADPSLSPGDPVLLVDRDDRLLAAGRLFLAPHELGRFRRGVAARVTAHARSPALADAPDPVAEHSRTDDL